MWTWVAFLGGSAVLLLWMSRAQPFPEIGTRWGWSMLFFAGILAITTQSPRDPNPDLPALLATSLGGLGVVVGIRHASVFKRDVLVAPFAGMWLAAGTVSLLAGAWPEFGQSEQIFGFGLATLVVMLEVFLFWKGLIIGVQGITWSQAALRQLERGLIMGERGAISMFDKSWSVEESWLDAMSHAALLRLHELNGDVKAAAHHAERLERLGGEEAVDSAWIRRVEACLRRLHHPNAESE
jgi:hypothetical protein